MKEAAGEANMTVITIVLIVIVLGVGSMIVSNLMRKTRWQSLCSEVGGKYSSNYTAIEGDNGASFGTCIDPETKTTICNLYKYSSKIACGVTGKNLIVVDE